LFTPLGKENDLFVIAKCFKRHQRPYYAIKQDLATALGIEAWMHLQNGRLDNADPICAKAIESGVFDNQHATCVGMLNTFSLLCRDGRIPYSIE
jgi:hypothetical protein